MEFENEWQVEGDGAVAAAHESTARAEERAEQAADAQADWEGRQEAFDRAQDELRNNDAIKEFKYLAGYEPVNRPDLGAFESLKNEKWNELTYSDLEAFPTSAKGLFPVLVQDIEGEYVTCPGVEYGNYPGSGGPQVGGPQREFLSGLFPDRSEPETFQNNDINTYFLLMPAQIAAYAQGSYRNDPGYKAAGTMTWQQYIESTYMMARGVGVGEGAGSVRWRTYAAGAGEMIERGLMSSPYHTTYDPAAPVNMMIELCKSYSPHGASQHTHTINPAYGFRIDNFISRNLTDVAVSEFTTSVTVEIRAPETAGTAATYTVTSTPSMGGAISGY
tara:strand:- start:138 stop:1133 length:996 start_codon:yes stop_codon:yes gene_type:complete